MLAWRLLCRQPKVEDNLLLNPSHPQIARIKVVAQQAFTFDRRLLG